MNSRLIALAILIRLLIIPWFYHPDIKSQLFHTQYLSRGVLNIYQFLDQNRHQLPYTNIFVYLPATYYFFGLINIILNPFYPSDLFFWLNDWSPMQNNYPNLPFFLLILKLPYFIADLLVALLLHKMSSDKKIAYFWLFNPFSLYSIYVQGNFDVIPVVLTLLAYHLLQRRHFSLSFLSLGFSIALKMFPIMFLPFFLLRLPPKFKDYFLALLFSTAPLLLSCLPFISTPAFLSSFVGSGLTQKITEFKLFFIPVYPVVYLTVVAFYCYRRYLNLEFCLLILMLTFFVFVRFHPQWLIWFLPLSLPAVLRNRFTFIFTLISLTLATLYVFLINDRFLFWGHLAPIDSEFARVTPPSELLKLRLNTSPETIQTFIKYSLSALTALIIINEKRRPSHLR